MMEKVLHKIGVVLLMGKQLYAISSLKRITLRSCLILSVLWCGFAEVRIGNVELFMPTISMVMMIIATMCGFFAVPAVFQSSLWQSLIKLPASPLEKIIAIIIIGIVSFSIIYIIPIVIAWEIGWLLNCFFWGNAIASFDIFSPNLISPFWAGISMVPVGVVIALYRNPRHLTLWVGLLLMSLIFMPFYFAVLFRGTPLEPLMETVAFHHEIELHLQSVIHVSKTVYTIISTDIWFGGIFLAAYFRLKESEA
jgi:hypothetical protein